MSAEKGFINKEYKYRRYIILFIISFGISLIAIYSSNFRNPLSKKYDDPYYYYIISQQVERKIFSSRLYILHFLLFYVIYNFFLWYFWCYFIPSLFTTCWGLYSELRGGIHELSSDFLRMHLYFLYLLSFLSAFFEFL